MYFKKKIDIIKMTLYTKEDCITWLYTGKNVNPKTNRIIVPGGAKYRQLEKQCQAYMKDGSGTDDSKCNDKIRKMLGKKTSVSYDEEHEAIVKALIRKEKRLRKDCQGP